MECDTISDVPRRVRIDNIPSGDWHIDHISGIMPSISRTEHNVRVLLSTYTGGDINRPSSQRQLETGKRQAIEVTVGASLALSPGGLCTGRMANYGQNLFRKQTFSLNINPETVRMCPLFKPFEVRPGDFSTFALEQIFAPAAGHEFRADWERTTCVGVDHREIRNRILIPSAALIWFYYISSSRTAQALFSSGLADVLKECGGRVQSGSDGRICTIETLPSGYEQSDAWLIARLLCDPTARDYALNVYHSLARQFVNPSVQPPYAFNADQRYGTGFPFTGPTVLTCRGIWIETAAKTRHFYVLQIELCSGAMGFDDVIVRSWPDGRAAERTKDGRVLVREKAQLSDEPGELNTDEEGSEQGAVIDLPLFGQRFKALEGKRVKGGSKASDERVYARAKTKPEQALSTGKHGSSRFQQVNFAQQGQASPVDPALDSSVEREVIGEFDELARRLNDIDELGFALRCDYRAVNNEEVGQRSALFYRVSEANPQKRAWMQIDGRPRRAFVLEIFEHHAHRLFYLLDIEKRDTEASAMVLAHTAAFGRADNSLLEAVLAHCAKHRGVWPYANTFTDFTTMRFPHSFLTTETRVRAVSNAIRNPSAVFQQRGKVSNRDR